MKKDELVDFLIEENAKLNKRLGEVGAANARRRKQLKRQHKGFSKLNKRLGEFAFDRAKRIQNDCKILDLQEEMQQYKLHILDLEVKNEELAKHTLMNEPGKIICYEAPEEKVSFWKKLIDFLSGM